jgi:glycerol-3-phosphate acyltransferase PlsY
MKLAVLLLGSYLVGSIPFGFIAGRMRGVDIRKHGSGNIGFSNVLRVLGPGVASVVLIGDVLKGVVPVMLGRSLLHAWRVPGPDLWLLAVALAPTLGHTFSIFLGFRGGRAVATAFGVLLAMVWQAALVGLATWLVVVAITRYISVASIAACAAVPAYLAYSGVRWEWLAFWTAVASLVIARHIPNIGRLLEGTESKIGERVKVE